MSEMSSQLALISHMQEQGSQLVAGLLACLVLIKVCKASRRAYLGLLSKALALYKRVVELGVGVADLPPVHKELKALCHAW